MSREPQVSTQLAPPTFSLAQAAALLSEHYGIEGLLEPLPSERDQNFRVTTGGPDRYVLKISEAAEDAGLVDCQTAILERLSAARTRFAFPDVVGDRHGRAVCRVPGPDDDHHLVRLLRYVPGVPFAAVRRRTGDLLTEVGTLTGTLSRVLAGFDCAPAHRELRWDLRLGLQVIAQCDGAITDRRRQAQLHRFVEDINRYGSPLLTELRTSVIHNDANDFNVIVSPSDPDDPNRPRVVSGIVDFGDVVHSYTVGELAVAAAYAMLHTSEPLSAMAQVVAGFHAVFPLTDAEIAAVYPLACLRLCMSVALAAHQRAQQPDNAYLSVSEMPVWSLLEQLQRVHPSFAHYRLRDACGLAPCPAARSVIRSLTDLGDRIGPVLDPDPRTATRYTLDFGVGSLEWSAITGRDDAVTWSEAIAARLRSVGASIGVGRYNEARHWYTAQQFRTPSDNGDAWRTVHLGVDLFAPAGAPVLAPLGGVVAAVRDNRGHLDYGPTVILRHDVADAAVCFHTLYGHLDREVLGRLVPGQRVERGDWVGRIGTPPDNGGWAPHLHLQIIVDPLDNDGDFPGVARASERRVWLSLSPDPNLILRLPEGCVPGPADPIDLPSARRTLIGPSLSLAYRAPLNIVRGWMQHLYDADGRAYLDVVNNVAHVGHCHPRVVDALRRQSAVLNTNTRYLHENIARYAQRLTERLPAPLRVCYFVSSGSEANELALRLARCHTGRRDVMVIDHAYHGNTSSLVEVSPYKFNGSGGQGAPAHVHVLSLPDSYRGGRVGGGGDVERPHDVELRETILAARAMGPGVGTFLAEAIVSGGGQVELPSGFLAEAYRQVRAGGGVCIADEVQIGFGRLGSHFWGFETQNVVPDIVTLGKPIGNGHPLGAVVTTPEIAASFDNGMEYFSTFGGNPVSCAVGLAVLDVIDDEELQARARDVGGHLTRGLRALMQRHPFIGDVRGRGLFLGVELVRDRGTRAPAPRHAAYVVERMKDCGILVSLEGPLHSVIKMKPPLVFSMADADAVVGAFDELLTECERPESGRPARDG